MTQEGWKSISWSAGAVVLSVFISVLPAQETDLTPTPMEETDFAALRSASPFNRVLDPAETYALRGIAAFEDIQIATLYNRKTKKTIVVTPEDSDEEGLKLVGVTQGRAVEPGRELEGVSARISIAGEEVELKYEVEQLSPKRQGKTGSSSGRSDGKGPPRKGPSKEDIERYKSLSEEKRNKLRGYIGHVMRSYPDMSREEKGNMIRGAMIRLSDGKDLDYPAPQQGGSSSQGRPRGDRR